MFNLLASAFWVLGVQICATIPTKKVCVCVRARASSRLTFGGLCYCSPLLIFGDSVFHWTWSLLIWLGWPAGELQGSACLCFLRVDVIGGATLGFLYEFWSSNLRSWWLPSSHFASWAISLSPLPYLLICLLRYSDGLLIKYIFILLENW